MVDFTTHDETTTQEDSKGLLEKAKAQAGFILDLQGIIHLWTEPFAFHMAEKGQKRLHILTLRVLEEGGCHEVF